MKNTNFKNETLSKETAQFGLKQEYGFAPAIEDIELMESKEMSFTFKVGKHEYEYNYRNDCNNISKLTGNEKSLRDQAKMYFDKWLNAIS